MMMFLLFLAVGALAGVLAGLFGIGGGMVIVPVLVLTLAAQGVSEAVLTHIAVATSLATIVFTSISSVREHHRKGAIDWSLVLILGIGIVLGTMLGVSLITSVPGPVLQNIIGVFALLLSLKMFFGIEPPGQGKRPGNAGLITAGGFIGFGSSWFGIGGGTFTVPYLTWMKVPMRHAVATSAACGLPIALTGAISNVVAGWGHEGLPPWSTGFLYWPAIVGIVITSVPFAKVGAILAHRLDQALLKKAFALLLLIVGCKFLFF
ncbi:MULTISPECIES: sulfite exporter TauE/SafE family protein [unclassified Thalassolituus]|uniref:sulfite exporter TauE/SafE family protein n=1 Tax=unclassified Thalassolituus TaxID=2624967 RepID=UPI0026B3656D|tara:strand:- start:1679 stop:2467 length:789 start_codon:yes stop_codon:yes gene_type:complete